ncbi:MULTISPECIES: serine/threonine-protein kinase [unclassified Shewanella]|uniref:serine/threonine-protein kinase n=1 Tax=Shewanella TaxID=22 RepID=UPI0021D901CC|nr:MULTISPECIES: serine/threonine-protein kinase [unclassified Shewanella]MCU8045115.1 serine/threonine protein kinase [Shewanella sp. SM68]MCU8049401.1 serine/threonine protein kinase [Shewanella sp. SM65]
MNIKSAHFLPGTNKRLGDKYLLLECLGDGSHGWVWRAERLQDGQIIAVKIPKDITREDRQLAEGKELLDVEPHDNIVQIFDMGRIDNEWFYIEMEYFPSQTLAQKLDDRQRNFGQTYERLFKIYRQVLCAVQYLAELPMPISHGDIKPHNILVGERDLVKLTDFGSSALPEEIYVRTRENGGTVLYSAPEFSNVDCRKGSLEELLLGDIYSLGVLLYQLLTGKLPHDTPAQVQRHAPFKRPTEINSSVHADLELVVLTCLQKQPEHRYSTVSELMQAFDAASNKQLKAGAVAPIFQTKPDQDWSSAVLEAMSDQFYPKAALLASQEYNRSKDLQALHQQLIALYRANRLFDFEKVVETNKSILLEGKLTQPAELFELVVKANLQLRNINQAKFWLLQRKQIEENTATLYLESSILGLEAKYMEARALLEKVNQATPMKFHILSQLVLVCEQMRDYSGAAAYLKAALRVAPTDGNMKEKKELYVKLGVI